jgi:hypothetical protein
MFFGGDPFAGAHGGGGGRGQPRARPDVDTDKLYETLGVRYLYVGLSCLSLFSASVMALCIAVMSITETCALHTLLLAAVSSVTIHASLFLSFSHTLPLFPSLTPYL